jgi:hypothetical protein
MVMWARIDDIPKPNRLLSRQTIDMIVRSRVQPIEKAVPRFSHNVPERRYRESRLQ